MTSRRAPRTRRPAIRAVFLPSVLVSVFVWHAEAQVNVESLRKEIRGDGVGAHLSGSLSTSDGNSEGVALGIGVLFGGRVHRNFGYFNGSADYLHLAGMTQTAKAFTHVRNNYELTPFLWSELFGQIEADRFRRLALRELLGAGPRFQLIRNPRATLFYGTAYMLEYARLSVLEGPPSDISSVAHRWSHYAAFSWMMGKSTTLSETLYVQPRFDDFEDLLALSVTNFELKLTAGLSTRIDLTARYDAQPPSQVEPFDIQLRNMLDLRF